MLFGDLDTCIGTHSLTCIWKERGEAVFVDIHGRHASVIHHSSSIRSFPSDTQTNVNASQTAAIHFGLWQIFAYPTITAPKI